MTHLSRFLAQNYTRDNAHWWATHTPFRSGHICHRHCGQRVWSTPLFGRKRSYHLCILNPKFRANPTQISWNLAQPMKGFRWYKHRPCVCQKPNRRWAMWPCRRLHHDTFGRGYADDFEIIIFGWFISDYILSRFWCVDEAHNDGENTTRYHCF